MEESENNEPKHFNEPQVINQELLVPQVGHANSIVEVNVSQTVQNDLERESLPSPKGQQTLNAKKTQPIDDVEDEIDKRSDNQEFVNWEIATVKSGKFTFEPKKTNEKHEPQKKEKSPPASKPESSNIVNHMTQSKVPKNENIAKKQPQKNLTDDFGGALKRLKPVKMLYSHFCKENNLTSIKSTLFEDKSKVMEEMSLNKWMVFCKEMDILERLYHLKVQESREDAGQETVSSPQHGKQQLKVKQLKKAQTILINVFRAAHSNRTKLDFESFVSALLLIYQQFKAIYGQDEDGVRRYLNEVLHCTSEKECLKKLSHLKFTCATPQISYEKKIVIHHNINTMQQSRQKRFQEKENANLNIQQVKNKKNYSATKLTNKLNINPVIRDAKQSLQKYQQAKYSFHNQKRKKLTLQPSKNKRCKNSSQNQLFTYFQATKDPILDSYFGMQKKVNGS